MLLEVYKCVQLNRCLCGMWVCCRGGRGHWTDEGESGSKCDGESEGGEDWTGELVYLVSVCKRVFVLVLVLDGIWYIMVCGILLCVVWYMVWCM